MSRELIAYCGLYCGACSFKAAHATQDREHLRRMPAKYDRLKDAPLEACPGCRLDGCGTACAIRDCAVEKKLEHCGRCDDFPCEKLTAFAGDGTPHHAGALENLRALRTMGEDRWLAEQEAAWTCGCGERFSWYLRECRRCGAPGSGSSRKA